MTPTERRDGAATLASGINVLAGIWLFVSPWVYGAAGNPNAWNSWILGALIAAFAFIQWNNPLGLRVLSWINCLIAIYTFCSPWIYGYTGNTGRFVNSLCVGVIVFVLAVTAITRSPRTAHPTGPSM